MPINVMPNWIVSLDDEDITFVKRFIMSSGSLKEIAKQYSVTYPTVRLRLDRLIQKIKIEDEIPNEKYISLIKRLALDEKIDFATAKVLISEYKKEKNEGDLV
ncbi:DUF2089 family protein [Mycoplasmatota bacterium]|nr:DUF2089 family protein [Mycoplasmatota bacterium]